VSVLVLSILQSKIVLIQALISTELLCCIFYLIQWLCADYMISAKTRENMKELGDLILASTLLLFIVSCQISTCDPVGQIASSCTAKTFHQIRSGTMHVCKLLSHEFAGLGKPLHMALLGKPKTNSRMRRHVHI